MLQVSRKIPLVTSIIAILLAGIIGIVLQFVFHTGEYTLLLGAVGAFMGFFYSTRPIRFVGRGVGEIFIGFCYGWLPVATSYYLQAGYVHPLIHLVSLPIGLTIFNVILLNEFPDYLADTQTGKRNLLVRVGKEKAVIIYIFANVLSWIIFLFSFKYGVPYKALYLYGMVFLVSLFVVVMMATKKYESQNILEILCGLNIAVNLGTTGAYIVAFI